jgi:hypothetical protein
MNFQIKLARLALAACFPAVFEAALPSAFAQGSLAPPGAPAPTMKTLDQIEARTPISAAPFTISQPGSYYLTNNVTVSSGDAITIAADNVTLDLNGFTIVSTRPAAAGDSAILLDGQRKNIAIFNGHISSGVTIIGPMFTGGGFGYGIRSSGDPGNSVRVKDVSVTGYCIMGFSCPMAAPVRPLWNPVQLMWRAVTEFSPTWSPILPL